MENEIDNSVTEYSDLSSSLNEISYKIDSLVFRQEEQTSAISQGFAIMITIIVIVIIYSFIKSFVDF